MTSSALFQIEVVTNTSAVAGAFAELHAICFALLPQAPWSSRALSTLLNSPGTVGVVALSSDGEAIGFVIGRAIGDEGEVLPLCVSPDHRRQGIASELMANLRELLAPRQRILLEVAVSNQAACDLYESLGFREVGRRPAYYRRAGSAVDALVLSSDPEPIT